ncbi:hypothetical protein [Streptomyces sasae]|uniref:hypothetical protein n=1 Tax=Streptomyces sasae TaxID=1266772 RepID=UPI0037428D22
MARPRTATRTVEHPDPSEVSLQQVLEALVDPVRRMVVSQLARADEDKSCGTFDLADVADAHRYMEANGQVGTIVVTVAHEDGTGS